MTHGAWRAPHAQPMQGGLFVHPEGMMMGMGLEGDDEEEEENEEDGDEEENAEENDGEMQEMGEEEEQEEDEWLPDEHPLLAENPAGGRYGCDAFCLKICVGRARRMSCRASHVLYSPSLSCTLISVNHISWLVTYLG